MSNKAISLKNLTMSFGEKEVLKGINLEVGKGEVIGYIGPNGAGKSTTIKIILGIVEGYGGQVEVLGKDISEGDISYKNKIGYIPEVTDIYDCLTAYEYLTFIGGLYGIEEEVLKEKIEAMIELFGISESLHSRISSYSKGMRQKVLIISSLIHNPDILFFDEPLTGLDANSVMIFKELMSLLAKEGKTIFYSSHIMDVVEKISDRIILINGGNIVANGSFEELKSSNNEDSLESIFNDLTGFNNHKEIAEKFVSLVKGE